MLLLAVCLVVAVLPLPTYAQDDVRPDTLDWHGYYPLDIGTIWEWRTKNGFIDLVRHRRIEADTLVDDSRWVIQIDYVEGTAYGDPVAAHDTLLLRYDEPYGRVLARSTATAEERDYTCDLSGDFGAEVLCGAALGEPFRIVMAGGYATDLGYEPLVISADTIVYAAVKQDPVIFGPVPPVYYHGVGRLPQPGDGFDGTIAFTYLRLHGIEYGSPAVFVSTEQQELVAEESMALFPNPASATLTVTFSDLWGPASLRVYDLRGRLALKSKRCASRCELDVRSLPAGVYLLGAEFRLGLSTMRRFIVAR